MAAKTVKLDPEKTLNSALDKFKSGDFDGALKLAQGSFAARRDNETLCLAIDCFLKLNQEGKARKWLEENQQLDFVIDGIIEIRKRAVAEGWRDKDVFKFAKA